MTSEQYRSLSAPFRKGKRPLWLNRVNKALTLACYAAYPLLIAWLLWQRDMRIIRAVLVPGVSFVALSVFRKVCNAPRPYEVLDMEPLIHKDTLGKSFPSRHVFSVFVIGMTFFWLNPALGAVFLVMGAVMAACRVIGGVHWPRDVVVGAAVGILAGMLGFYFNA